MFKVEHIGSAGQVAKTYTAKDADHADRLRARVRSTFAKGSSEQVKVTKN